MFDLLFLLFTYFTEALIVFTYVKRIYEPKKSNIKSFLQIIALYFILFIIYRFVINNEIINILNNENTKYWNMNVDSILSNYCYFNSENLKKYFKIDTNLNVIVNFYTGNIIEKNGVKDVKNRIIYK